MGKMANTSIRWHLLPMVLLLVGVASVAIAFSQILPWVGVADKPEIGTQDLVQLALQNTLYLQGLTTAVLGGALLLIGQQQPQGGTSLPLKQLLVGFIFLALALLTGFVTSETIIEAAVQSLVHSKIESFLWL